jgi:hypothetical protein
MTAAQLDRRLLAYSLTAGAVAAGSTAGAAIVYTNLDPDVVVDAVDTSYALDLNGDAANDFILERDFFENYNTLGVGNRQTFVNAMNLNTNGTFSTFSGTYLQNKILASTTNSGVFGAALGQGAPVSSANPDWSVGSPHLARAVQGVYRTGWMTGTTTSSPGWMTYSNVPYGPYRYGPWHGQGERFLGLAFYIDGALHYGWARCTLAADLSTLTIHDFAYQDVAGASILAGDAGTTATPGRALMANAGDAGIVGGQFTTTPKITGLYFDPIKDPGKAKQKKAAAKVLDKPTVDAPMTSVRYEWIKKVKLFDPAAFKAAYKEGTVAAAQKLTQTALDIDLWLDSKELDAPVDMPDITLDPPTIAGVFNAVGDEIMTALPGDEITIRGALFGQKPPKVWMEYRVDGAGPVKKKSLKVLKPYEYDAKGKVGNSVMDPESGISEIRVLIPAKLPKGWLFQAPPPPPDVRRRPETRHDIVIDNGIGVATTPFDTLDPLGPI